MKIARVAVPALALLTLAGCKEEKADQTPVVRPVLSVIADAAPVRTAGFAGTIEPRYQANLGFRVLGRVVVRDAGLGETVKKGSRLAALDPLALELAVRSASASVQTAEAHLAAAAASEERSRKLLERNVTSVSQFDLARRNRETAAASLDEARANLAKAKEQLGYAQLFAEFDGVVTAVQSEIGQVVSPGQTIMTIARSDTPEAVVDVPDHLLDGLCEGAAFDVGLQIDPMIKVSGRLREIGPAADPITRTRRIRIELIDAPRAFRLGTTVTATPTASALTRVAVPASGLFERDGTPMVWVIDPVSNTVAAHAVKIGAREQDRVEVVDGLARGSRVVVAGVNSLTGGQRVKISEEGASK